MTIINTNETSKPPLSLTVFSQSQPDPITPLSICIVTPDLLGPVRNGGIGTANTFLAFELANAGHQVTILFTQLDAEKNTTPHWLNLYQERDIKVVIANCWQIDNIPNFPGHPVLAMAYKVHNWLSQQSFNSVIFQEWQGHGFYALQAKCAGLNYQQTAFITQTHSPSMWHAVNNAELSTDPLQSIIYFIERKSIELADAIISPSAYMLDWLHQHDFKLPSISIIQPNIINVQGTVKPRGINSLAVDELVFFGRLEYRKGLVQFCDALDKLMQFKAKPKAVTFLGKFSRIGNEHSALYLSNRAKNWDFPISIKANCDQNAAISYLLGKSRLAIMPSVADNSPYTVYECLVSSIPFFARNVGGVAELIEPDDRDNCLFDDNPRHLASKLVIALEKGVTQPRLAFDTSENQKIWRSGLPGLINTINQSSYSKNNSIKSRKPLVSVCLTHFNRPDLLKQAVASLRAQDYQNFEVIVTDDGSPGAETAKLLQSWELDFEQLGWKILRLENGYLGRARNKAVSISRGEYILFMDDDNVAKPNMISRFILAACSSGAELISCVFNVFSGGNSPDKNTPIKERYLPVGDIISFSVVSNAIGDANSLIKRDLFNKLGGFSEDYGVGYEDFELYLRAILEGVNTLVIPEALFWYRRNETSMLSTTQLEANQLRALRPFIENLPAPLAELVVMTRGILNRFNHTESASSQTYELSDQDHQQLISGAPDSAKTISIVSNILMQSGQQKLALSLLRDIAQVNEKNTSSEKTYQAGAMAIVAAQKGDFEQMTKILNDIDAQETEISEKNQLDANVYLSILDIIIAQYDKTDFICKLIERLLIGSPKSVKIHLKAVDYFLTINELSKAIHSFENALTLADAHYCKRRTDVADAIKRKTTVSGLNHYQINGRQEGETWSELKQFQALSPKLTSIFNVGEYQIPSEVEIPRLLLAANLFNSDKPSKETQQLVSKATENKPFSYIDHNIIKAGKAWIDQLSVFENPSLTKLNNSDLHYIRGWILSSKVVAKANTIIYCVLKEKTRNVCYYAPIFQRTNRGDLLSAVDETTKAEIDCAGFVGHLNLSEVPKGTYKLTLAMPFFKLKIVKWIEVNTEVEIEFI